MLNQIYRGLINHKEINNVRKTKDGITFQHQDRHFLLSNYDSNAFLLTDQTQGAEMFTTLVKPRRTKEILRRVKE